MSDYRILEGDCLDVLASLPAESVQTCITSPPYWGLRDYGADGQLGLEPTPEEYVANMVDVFREVRRVLRPDGTLWLNLGDSYAAKARGSDAGWDKSRLTNPGTQQKAQAASLRPLGERYRGQSAGLKNKDLVGIPWMVAFALRADGWYLRSDIIWAKPNPMPESVTDRPTKSHEYLFLLTKSPRYFYDADAIREDAEDRPLSSWDDLREVEPIRRGDPGTSGHVTTTHTLASRAGRNKRSVWTVTTQPFPGAHFATFPPKLIEPCVLAGTPPKCCGECGAPWERVMERAVPARHEGTEKQHGHVAAGRGPGAETFNPAWSKLKAENPDRFLGWRSTCDHDDDSGTPTVLDPFNGAGTTGLVALRHNRDYIGIELNPEYAQMARNRIHDDAPLLNLEAA